MEFCVGFESAQVILFYEEWGVAFGFCPNFDREHMINGSIH